MILRRTRRAAVVFLWHISTVFCTSKNRRGYLVKRVIFSGCRNAVLSSGQSSGQCGVWTAIVQKQVHQLRRARGPRVRDARSPFMIHAFDIGIGLQKSRINGCFSVKSLVFSYPNQELSDGQVAHRRS